MGKDRDIVRLELGENAREVLEEVKFLRGYEKDTEAFMDALLIYFWFVQQMQAGNSIYVEKGDLLVKQEFTEFPK